ncbi:hypothetical protein [Streptomyces griseosporeus]
MNGPHGVHTADNAIPPLDDELANLLDDLAAIHDPGIDQIISGLLYIALSRHTTDHSQNLIHTLAGGMDGQNTVTAIGLVIARLSDPDTNPSLRTLPLEQQKNARLAGADAAYWLADPDLHQTASETAAAITGT